MVAFVAVVQSGGFTAAARDLGIQKATVSRRVAALEEHLGGTLLQRTTRRSRLTATGTVFYERAAKVVAGAREAEAAARASAGKVTGTLRVCLPQHLGDLVADSVLIAFLKAHPETSLDVDFATRPADPLRDGYDIVIRPGEVESSALRSRRLPEGGAALVAAPGYLARTFTPKRPSDLARHDGIIGTAGAENEWPLYDANGPVRVALRTRLRVPSSRIALRAVLGGWASEPSPGSSSLIRFRRADSSPCFRPGRTGHLPCEPCFQAREWHRRLQPKPSSHCSQRP